MMKQFDRTRYNMRKYRQLIFRLDREKDRHIIEKLDTESNKTDYIRTLINEDMRKDDGKEKERL